MTPILLSGPAAEPLTLDEARAWLRLDDPAENELVAALVKAARIAVEQATRRALIAQKWRLRLDAWPLDRIVPLPLSPILSLDAVRIFDAAGNARALDLAGFYMERSPRARLFLDVAQPPPGRLRDGIEIDITIGYGVNANAVPESLRQAMRMLVAFWYERRGDALHEHTVASLPPAVAALVAPFRSARLT